MSPAFSAEPQICSSRLLPGEDGGSGLSEDRTRGELPLEPAARCDARLLLCRDGVLEAPLLERCLMGVFGALRSMFLSMSLVVE